MGIGRTYQQRTIEEFTAEGYNGALIDDDPYSSPIHPIASQRALFAFVKLAVQDLLPLANLPQHKAIKAYGEAAVEMIDTHCIIYDLDEWSKCKELTPELQELLKRSRQVLVRLLKVKAIPHEDDED